MGCQCVDKGPLTLALLPSAATVAAGATIDLMARLDLFADSHLPSVVAVDVSFDAAVLEPVSAERTSGTATWQENGELLEAGLVRITITAGNVLHQSSDVLVIKLRAIGSSGASTAVTFNAAQTKVLSVSECDQNTENVIDATSGATITVL